MNFEWIPTNEYYHRLLDIKDDYERQQLYLELFVQPWKPMMDVMTAQFGGAGDDPLAGARRWNWLLPDQTDQIAALLATMEAAKTWERGGDALLEAVARFKPYTDRLPAIDTLSGWLMLADATRSNPYERGYTGATDWFQPRFLGQFWEPNEHNLFRIGDLVAHEMHHLIRLRLFPFNMATTSVADYIVIEGTAEAFATSIFGEDTAGYFVTEISDDELETARRLIGANLNVTGFNAIRAYIFGDALAERSGFTPVGGMPAYGGYAVGYRVVQAFLKKSGLSIEEATFLPANEIVAGSGFFD